MNSSSITWFGAPIAGLQRHCCCTSLPLENETHTLPWPTTHLFINIDKTPEVARYDSFTTFVQITTTGRHWPKITTTGRLHYHLQNFYNFRANHRKFDKNIAAVRILTTVCWAAIFNFLLLHQVMVGYVKSLNILQNIGLGNLRFVKAILTYIMRFILYYKIYSMFINHRKKC